MTCCEHKQSCCQSPMPHFSEIGKPKGNSAILQILALAARPDVISFGGGLPAPEGFPVSDIKAACDWVLDHDGPRSLQYSATAGMAEFRRALADWESEKGVETKPENVLVCSGSQQGLDMIARLFLDPGAKILVESPTYLGALQAFDLCRPTYVELPTDENGLNPDAIGEEAAGARIAYVMPTFANPTGRTMDEERRKKLAEKAREYDFWILEDNPYGEIYYDKHPPLSMRAYAPERTITLNTMSKVLAPGFRLGYFMGPTCVIDALSEMKTAVDLHTSTFTQLVTARCLETGLMRRHLPSVRAIYKSHAETMLKALDEYMPKHPDLHWTKPSGGMFIWVEMPESVQATELLKACVEAPVPVAFVPGEPFFAKVKRSNCMRLSFVTVPDDKIIAGVKTIAECLKKML